MKIKLTTLIIIALIISTVTSFLVFFFLQNITAPVVLYETKVIPMNIEVADFIGFDLNNSELEFGAAFPGGRSRRNITITNNYNNNILVTMQFDGEMKDWVSGFEKKFILRKEQYKEMMLIISPPSNTNKGNYSGTAYISFYKAK